MLEKHELIIRGLLNAAEAHPDLVATLGELLAVSSGKGINSEDISIDEAGAATKTCLDDPDGWIKFGTNKNVPIYND